MATQCNQTVLTVDNFCAGRSSGTFDIESLETQGENTVLPFTEGYIYYTGEVTVVLCCIPDENSITWDTNLINAQVNVTSTPPPYEEDTEITVSLSIATPRPFQLSDAGPVYFNVLISCGSTVYEYPVNLVDSVGCDSKQRVGIGGIVTVYDFVTAPLSPVILAYNCYQTPNPIAIYDGASTSDPLIIDTGGAVSSEGYFYIQPTQRYMTVSGSTSNRAYKVFCDLAGTDIGVPLLLQSDYDLQVRMLVSLPGLSGHHYQAYLFDCNASSSFTLAFSVVAPVVATTIMQEPVGYKLTMISFDSTVPTPIHVSISALSAITPPVGLDPAVSTTEYNSSATSIDAYNYGRVGSNLTNLNGTLNILTGVDHNKVIVFLSTNTIESGPGHIAAPLAIQDVTLTSS